MDQPTRDHRYHAPVLVDRVVDLMEPAAHGWIVDATFGGGGHSRALLARHPDVRVVGIDRDPDAVAQAPVDDRLTVVLDNYRDLGAIIDRSPAPPRVQGILFDLGVSSHQLDEPHRGFSYRTTGPLDMRMGPDAAQSAADLVDTASEGELAEIIRSYGEERFARRIATAIVARRPFATTTDLAECIADAVPAPARRARHPARRTFQALRIAVNDELTGVEDAVATAVERLSAGGVLIVISYHSLEDRIVKGILRDRSRTCTCPPDLPVCACGATPVLRELTRKVVRPSAAEIAENPRARSAVLRAAERVAP